MKNKENNQLKTPIIAFSKYSPYTIISLEKLTNSKGKVLAVENVFSLCRCGSSKMKPYCDGSHAEKGINGTKDENYSSTIAKKYVGENITIIDNRSICCHDASCVKNLPTVFKRDDRPWIDPEGASVKNIIETVEKCPSGALSYKLGANHYQNIEREPEIFVSENGPLHIKGFIKLEDDQNSMPDSAEHYTLCRCGGSKNPPFCDGSHDENGFTDSEN